MNNTKTTAKFFISEDLLKFEDAFSLAPILALGDVFCNILVSDYCYLSEGYDGDFFLERAKVERSIGKEINSVT